MDFRSDDEGKDIIRTLHWLAKNEKGRDLTFMRHHANSLQNSITCSTMGIESDDEDEVPVHRDPNYQYLMSAIASHPDDRMGFVPRGQSQSEERMDMH